MQINELGKINTLGTEIQVPTLENTEKMKIESGTQPNSILKLKGKGLPRQNSGQRGDQYIRVVVEVPKKYQKSRKTSCVNLRNQISSLSLPNLE